MQWDPQQQAWDNNGQLLTAQQVAKLYSYGEPIVGATIWQGSPNRYWIV
jgi:hypothetical protein